jgi:AcrR family transcriptional regulator
MDDVAKELSVSKKTLYQHFKNKDELVSEVASLHMNREKTEFDQIAKASANAIEELFLLSKCMREHVFKINPSLLYDLEKYHADAWDIFQQFKKQTIMKQVIENIERGIEEGYYRKGIDPNVIAILRMEVIQMVFNDRIFPRDQFDFVEVQLQIFDHFVHGLLSEKGKKQYEHYQKQEDKLLSK